MGITTAFRSLLLISDFTAGLCLITDEAGFDSQTALINLDVIC